MSPSTSVTPALTVAQPPTYRPQRVFAVLGPRIFCRRSFFLHRDILIKKMSTLLEQGKKKEKRTLVPLLYPAGAYPSSHINCLITLGTLFLLLLTPKKP